MAAAYQQVEPPKDPGCYVKPLPERLYVEAAKTAKAINPANDPFAVQPDNSLKEVLAPQHIALLTSKYWGAKPRTLTVSFLELAPQDLQQRILQHMNAWDCCITFQLLSPGYPADVRITLMGQGYWSYIGTDVLHVPSNTPTMCLQGFSMQTAESEYRRVVRHETGHTLGFPHEHLRREVVSRINPGAAYQYFGQTQGWSPQMVQTNVLQAIDPATLTATAIDTVSIMCYQLPGQIMIDGQPVLGGTDINNQDRAFCLQMYPKAGAPTNPTQPVVPVQPVIPVQPVVPVQPVQPAHPPQPGVGGQGCCCCCCNCPCKQQGDVVRAVVQAPVSSDDWGTALDPNIAEKLRRIRSQEHA